MTAAPDARAPRRSAASRPRSPSPSRRPAATGTPGRARRERYPGTPRGRYLSLGAGVQSLCVLLLACQGEISPFDGALFADTGWEPKQVYAQLATARRLGAQAGIPVRTVSNGNIRLDTLNPAARFVWLRSISTPRAVGRALRKTTPMAARRSPAARVPPSRARARHDQRSRTPEAGGAGRAATWEPRRRAIAVHARAGGRTHVSEENADLARHGKRTCHVHPQHDAPTSRLRGWGDTIRHRWHFGTRRSPNQDNREISGHCALARFARLAMSDQAMFPVSNSLNFLGVVI